jgi:hypothetical protein
VNPGSARRKRVVARILHRHDPFAGTTMPTTEAERHSHGSSHEPQDPVEKVVGAIPLVLPVMGGVLIFMLAFIAIYMA